LNAPLHIGLYLFSNNKKRWIFIKNIVKMQEFYDLKELMMMEGGVIQSPLYNIPAISTGLP